MPRLPGRPLARRLLSLAAALAASSPALAQGPFTSLTVFGDSYSDTGNLTQLTNGTQPPVPPYAPGRVSNGPVWVDYFALRLGRPADAAPVFVTQAASGNYAIGAARTAGSTPPGTQQQVGRYLTRPGATPGAVVDPTGLYVIFAGANDLRDAGASPDAATREALAADAAQRVVTQAGALANAGARSILVFSFPSLGVTPEAQAIPGRPAALDAIAGVFNGGLAQGLAGLQSAQPLVSFYNFRLDNLYQNILADAAGGGLVYGFTNLTTPCLPGIAPTGAPSCDVSVFADALHPTTRVHALIADATFGYLTTGQNVAIAPEPSTVALVAGGLLVLVVSAPRVRRSRAGR